MGANIWDPVPIVHMAGASLDRNPTFAHAEISQKLKYDLGDSFGDFACPRNDMRM